jgi:hypothetical protein
MNEGDRSEIEAHIDALDPPLPKGSNEKCGNFVNCKSTYNIAQVRPMQKEISHIVLICSFAPQLALRENRSPFSFAIGTGSLLLRATREIIKVAVLPRKDIHEARFLHMAGYRITPVLGFRTCRDLHWEFSRLWTGFELPSSWHTLPAYGTHLNRNILDFMK